MNKPVALPDGRVKCSVSGCGADVWRARFSGGDFRLVEPAGVSVVPGGRFQRGSGHVALSFPLPGTGADIIGTITRKLTRYRLHTHEAFSAALSRAQRKAAGR